MREMIRVALLVGLVSLIGSGVSVAQLPQAGDFVLMHPQFIYVKDPATGSLRTLPSPTNLPMFADYVGMTLAENNQDLILEVGDWASTPGVDSLVRLVPGQTTVTTLGRYCPTCKYSSNASFCVELAQDGVSYLTMTAETGSSGTIYAVNRVQTSGPITTFQSFPLSHQDHVGSMIQDPVTGDLFLGIQTTSNLELWQVDHDTRAITTVLKSIPGSPTDVEPRTGNFVTGVGDDLLVFDRNGTIVTSITHTVFGILDVKVDDFTGHYFVADNRGKLGCYLTEYSTTGTPLKTWQHLVDLTAFEIYGSRRLSGAGPARPGTSYTVRFAFPGLAHSTYLGALSFSFRPGIPLGNGILNLTPDALFFASLSGALVQGFVGTLDGQGKATGQVAIPSFVPPGITFYCSAIAASGSTIRAGNTIGITVRP